MENIEITLAEYIYVDGVRLGIKATVNGKNLCIPMDPRNRHYKEILRQTEAKTLVIQEAEE